MIPISEPLFQQIFWGNFIASIISTTLFWTVPIIIFMVLKKKYPKAWNRIKKHLILLRR